MDRIILHCDLNYFYANVEMLYHPETRDLPIAVGGDQDKRHGIILAKNPLARSFGVKTGEAIWQAKTKCPNLLVYPASGDKYHKFSRAAKAIFLEYSPKLESYGIDEAWLDVSDTYHLFGSPYHLAYRIKERIKKELGLTLSIGISYNKVFAKLGSDYQKVDAITIINRENKTRIIDPLPVENLLMVGPNTTSKLHSLGIFTIGDLAVADAEMLKQRFGKVGTILSLYANGLDDGEVDVSQDTRLPKSVGNSTTTSSDMTSYQDIYLTLSALAQSVTRRLKQQKLQGRCISVSIRTNDLQYFSWQKTLAYPSNLYRLILSEGFALLKYHYNFSKPLRSLGITVSQLSFVDTTTQLSLFDNQLEEELHLETTIDQIRSRFGHAAINYAMLFLDKELLTFSPSEHPATFPLGSKYED